MSVSSPHADVPANEWLDYRETLYNRLTSYMKHLKGTKWEMCMSGPKAQNFISNFKDVKLIGKGTFGQVYRALFHDEPLVIKEAYLERNEERVIKKHFASLPPPTGLHRPNPRLKMEHKRVPKNTYPEEFAFMELMSQLILDKCCPHFLHSYELAFCDNCRVVGLFGDGRADCKSPKCYTMFMEAVDGDVTQVETYTEDQQRSMLYQLLLAVHCLHKLGIVHNDIKNHNVFVTMIKPGGYFKYYVNSKTYYVKNCGIFVHLGDFGVAQHLRPKTNNATKWYGTRNARVVTEANGRVYFEPFTIKHVVGARGVLVKPAILNWKDNVSSTVNVFSKLGDPQPSINDFDVNDFNKFPAFEFFTDIQNVIRMFTGGSRLSGNKHIDPEMSNLAPKLKLDLMRHAFCETEKDALRLDGVRFYRADIMFETLYKPPSNPVLKTQIINVANLDF